MIRSHERLARSLTQLDEAERILALLGAGGVQVVLLKGAALLDLVYRLDERPMADVDLLVRPERLEQAHGLLTAAGYTWRFDPRRAASERHFHERAYTGQRGVNLDLHTALDETRRWRIHTDELFERAQPATLGSQRTLRLANEDALLHIAIHMAKDEHGVAGWGPEDAARIIARLPVDWPALSERARRWGCRAPAYLALLVARNVAGAAVPDDVLCALRPSLGRLVYLRLWIDPTRHPSFRFPGWRRRRQLALRLALLDRWSERIADLLGTAWRLSADLARRQGREVRS